MAAANSDKFRKKKNLFSTTLNGGITDVATSLTAASLTDVPTDTAVTVTVDRVDANGASTPSLREDITGVVSGSNITNLLRGEGATTAQAHANGAVVEITWETETWNDAVDGILAGHNQDGTHKSALVTTLKASAADVTTGTEDAKIVTPKALKDASIVAVTLPVKASGVEVNAGTDDAKFATSKAIKDGQRLVTAYSPAGAGTTTIDLSLGNVFTVTMPANTQTLAISNETAGQCFILNINNVTSQGALTWFTTIKWAGGTAPTLTGTNGKRDVFGFIVTGADTYDGFVVGQNI